MKTKVLAMLLAVVMIACLIPFSASAATVDTYYVAETGADTNDGSQAAPFATVRKALAAAIAKSGTYAPGDSVVINVSGSTSDSGGSGFFNASANSSFKSVLDSAGNFVPVTIQGSTANAADTVITLSTTDGIGSTVRKYNTVNLTLKNLTLKAKTAEYISISAHVTTLTFDNVIFDESGFAPVSDPTAANSFGGKSGWLLDCGNNNNQNTKNWFASLGKTSDDPFIVNSGIVLKNGDYTNVEIAGLLVFGGDLTSLANTGEYHATLTIGENAKAGDIVALNALSSYKDVKVVIDPSATVASVVPFANNLTDDLAATDVTIDNKGVVTVNGVAVGGGNSGAVTADASSVVFFSVLAVLSLAGVVVLKKQSVR